MVPGKLEEAKKKKLRGEAIAHGQRTPSSLAVNQPIRLMFMDEARFGRISETCAELVEVDELVGHLMEHVPRG